MSRTGLFVGIDPGLSGAVGAIIGDRAFVWDFPTYKTKIGKSLRTRIDEDQLQALAFRVARLGPVVAMIERVQGMRDDDGSRHTAYTFGEVTGQIRQSFVAAKVPRASVPPATWKLRLGLRGQPKDASRALACRLFPSSAHLFARRKDDGRAEAVLIAHYARMTHGA